jgi:hypothetical protein
VRILFDQGVPAPLRAHLPGHEIQTAYELGWSTLRNGELLDRAEPRFDALITTDRNLKSQQDLSRRKIAILVLPTTSWPLLQAMVREIADALQSLGDVRVPRAVAAALKPNQAVAPPTGIWLNQAAYSSRRLLFSDSRK